MGGYMGRLRHLYLPLRATVYQPIPDVERPSTAGTKEGRAAQVDAGLFAQTLARQ
jgi:hypothetical protein